MQDMVQTAVNPGAFQRQQVGHGFHEANLFCPAIRVATDIAEHGHGRLSHLGQITALGAAAQARGGFAQGVEQWLQLLRLLHQQMQRNALGRPEAQSGQLAEHLLGVVEARRHLKQSRHLKLRGYLVHFFFIDRFGLRSGLLDGVQNGLPHHGGVFFQKFRVQRQREKIARRIDLDAHRPASRRYFQFARSELLLHLFNLFLRFLRLFEKFAESSHGSERR